VRVVQRAQAFDQNYAILALNGTVHNTGHTVTQIGERYQLGELIGQGGMGEVYHGIDLRTEQPVAIKHLRAGIVANPELLTRFRREAAALRELNHPNIVKILEMVEQDNTYYLVMEYIDGGDLGSLLKTREKLPVAEAIKISLELADALSRAHHLGIIHRDIKPANVLIARDGTPRLTDFGVARIEKEERLTETGGAVGTLDYMPPEAINGEPVDLRADIWAFGVMLFELLVGKRPFSGDTTLTLLTNIINLPTPDLRQDVPDVPADLQALIEQMLQKDRDLRIRSARQVGAALEAILQGAPISLQRSDTPTPPSSLTLPVTVPLTVPLAAAPTQPQPASIAAPEITPQKSPTRRLPPQSLAAFGVALVLLIAGLTALLSGGVSLVRATPTPTATATPIPQPTIAFANDEAPDGYEWQRLGELRLLVPIGWTELDREAFINVGRPSFSEVNAAQLDIGIEWLNRMREMVAYVDWLSIEGFVVGIEDTGVVLNEETRDIRFQELTRGSGAMLLQPAEVVTLPIGVALKYQIATNLSLMQLYGTVYSIQQGMTEYAIIFAARPDQLDDLQPTIDIVLNSLRIEPAEESP
jgi:serine/threonine protein kinase